MRRIVATAIVVIVLIAAGLAAYIYSGDYYAGADRPHWGPVAWAIDQALTRSIKNHAAGIAPPPGLDDRAKIVEGAGHYAEDCVFCHGAPGTRRGEVAAGMYPHPPGLAAAARSFTPGELFWIVKHGIRMTGMPSWGDRSDDELWSIVAFLEKLPGMKPQDYAALVAASRPQPSPAEPGVGSAQPAPALAQPPPRHPAHHRRH